MTITDQQTYHFAGILLTIFLAAIQSRAERVGSLWLILSTLPGTVLHELAHFVVALVTGGRPRGLSIMPKSRDCTYADGSSRRMWVLGSVSLGRVGTFSAVPTALAPLGLIMVAWFFYHHWFTWFPSDLLHTLCLYLIIYVFCSSSIPSKQDLKVAFSSLSGLLLYGLLTIFFFCAYMLPA